METLRAVCKSIPELQANTERTNRCLDDALRLSRDRNTIIHGHFHGISGEDEPQLYFRNAPSLTGEVGDRLLMTSAELIQFLDGIDRATFDLWWIMMGVMSACGGKALGKAKAPQA